MHKQEINNYIKCYSGYSTNKDVRYNSASGGIVTQVLLYLLEEGIIDGALVSRMKKGLEAETIIAKTPEEILSAAGSIYKPVPFFAGIQELSKLSGKYAVVGLPCHLRLLNNEKFSEVRKKIIFKIALFCNHTPSSKATEFLVEKKGIKKEEVEFFRYRGLGKPGLTIIETKDKKTQIPFHVVWTVLDLPEFYSIQCKECKEHLSKESDISCGDTWLTEHEKDIIGTSLIISRTNIGNEILKEMKKQHLLSLEEVDFRKIFKSQGYEIIDNNG